MKAKYYIVIGGAVALFLLYKNKNKKVGTSTTTGGATTTGGTTTTGGATTTGGMPFKRGDLAMPLLADEPKKIFNLPIGDDTPPLPTNEPEQIFLGLPTGMDLPILTAGTGVPTEVAVQQGGVNTTPDPIYEERPKLGTENALASSGIIPIDKSYLPIYQTMDLPLYTNNTTNTRNYLSTDFSVRDSEGDYSDRYSSGNGMR